MTKDQATQVFAALEDMRHSDGEDSPIFHVRLDALSDNRDDSRDFRVRVTAGPYPVGVDSWGEVMLVAQENDAAVRIDNNGIELS